jgi:hypothetical protein
METVASPSLVYSPAKKKMEFLISSDKFYSCRSDSTGFTIAARMD